ncbi:MAG TPA: 30S ribosome-binding factor RbfA [Dehalococcoidales bacterium]|nr:30S ribosome-binding factor RbfA [Dehalococcoidales bacterium]
MSSHRIERVNTQIKREISELIQQHLRDPRLTDFIAVTEVATSPDLKHAKIFVSGIGGQAEEQPILSALNSASGFLRSSLAKRMKMRYTPELHFAWDSSIEHGDKVLRLLDQIESEKEK